MGIASIMLQDGTPVTVSFTDNGDGKIDSGEITRAQNRLIEKLDRDYKLTGEVLIGSQFQIIESGQSSNVRPLSVSAGALVNNNVVKLFGSPPTRSKKTPEGSQDWVATATHDDEIYYREMGRWDEVQGQEVEGRGLHVDPDSGKIKEVEVTEKDKDGVERRVWKPLDKLSAEEKEGLPIGVLPTEAVAWSQPEITPVSWRLVGTQDEYHYFQGPGQRMARRSATNSENVQIAENVEGTPVWRAAEEGEMVPIVVTVGEGKNARTFSVVKTDVTTDKITTPDGLEEKQVYNQYAGAEFPSNSAVVLRRPVVESEGSWEIRSQNGFEPLKVTPQEPEAADQGGQKAHHQGRRGGHGMRKKPPKPTGPDIFY